MNIDVQTRESPNVGGIPFYLALTLCVCDPPSSLRCSALYYDHSIPHRQREGASHSARMMHPERYSNALTAAIFS